MTERVKGRQRESADGLRDRDRAADRARLRETRQRIAEEASRRRKLQDKKPRER